MAYRMVLRAGRLLPAALLAWTALVGLGCGIPLTRMEQQVLAALRREADRLSEKEMTGKLTPEEEDRLTFVSEQQYHILDK